MMKFFDVQHPMFRPLWLRLLIVGLSCAWTVVELRSGNGVWALLFAGAAGYLGWQFFVVFDPDRTDENKR